VNKRVEHECIIVDILCKTFLIQCVHDGSNSQNVTLSVDGLVLFEILCSYSKIAVVLVGVYRATTLIIMGKRFDRLRDKLSPQSDKYENILGLDFCLKKL